MTFEEFENASPWDLNQKAKQCFDSYGSSGNLSNEFRLAALLEAQFYMGEFDRRTGARTARRDFWKEVAVIFLIGIEIVLSVVGIYLGMRDGRDQASLMTSQNTLLASLQSSSNITAQTLEKLQLTTETMNRAVQEQLAMNYDLRVSLSYDPNRNYLVFQNNGPTNIVVVEWRSNGELWNALHNKLIAPNSYYGVLLDTFYPKLAKEVVKGTLRIVPLEATLRNERGKIYLNEGPDADALAGWTAHDLSAGSLD